VLPVVDLSSPARRLAGEIGRACRDNGFFYVVGHGVPAELLNRLDTAGRRFFGLPEADKMEIAMRHGGTAWRGFFPVGAELTSGRPDRKEGLYFGEELGDDDPRVRTGLPLHDDWGVGEHTDYGLLTLLAQDANGGLQVRSADGWIDAPPIPGAFVCNIGDMLDRLTGGYYRSTPHRVRNLSGRDRLSFPFFFDPDFTAEVPPLPRRTTSHPRWDGQDLQAFTGTYGDYLINKVSHVFPQLRRQVRLDQDIEPDG
jgi:isopenicillin N synthase-like dioxygenase